jgi:hypothetical protein
MMMNNVEKMEKLVETNKSFYWEGWDLVHIQENPDGYMRNDGVFKDGKWYTKKIFKLENNGWNIPDRILKGV